MSSTYDVNAEVAVHDPRQRNIGDLTDALEAVLSPLASRGQDAGRRQDLEGLIVRGAQYGWLLFSQPTTWAFDWEIDIGPHGEGVGAGELVILPALMQTGDETGKRHKIARGITEAQRVKLGS